MISLDTYYSSSQYKGTSGTNIGREGYVPQAKVGESGNYLRGDGQWVDFGLANLTSTYTTVRSLSDSWEESAFITPLQTASASWDSVYTTTNSNSGKWESNYTSFNTNSANYINLGTVQNYLSGSGNTIFINENNIFQNLKIGIVNVTGSDSNINGIYIFDSNFSSTGSPIAFRKINSNISIIRITSPLGWLFTGLSTIPYGNGYYTTATYPWGNSLQTPSIQSYTNVPGIPAPTVPAPSVTLTSVKKLDLLGSILSVSTIQSLSTIIAQGGTSDNWNSVYTTTNSNSGKWESNYTSFNTNSANYDSVYTTTNSNSASWTGLRLIQISDFSATPGSYYIVNTTSAPITGYLPQSPSSGLTITFQDSFIQWQTNNFTLNRNGNMIQGLNEDMICDRGGIMFSVTYIGGSVGWRVN